MRKRAKMRNQKLRGRKCNFQNFRPWNPTRPRTVADRPFGALGLHGKGSGKAKASSLAVVGRRGGRIFEKPDQEVSADWPRPASGFSGHVRVLRGRSRGGLAALGDGQAIQGRLEARFSPINRASIGRKFKELKLEIDSLFEQIESKG